MPFDGRFANKHALVTGGASGIGLATATRLSQEGATVAVADLNQAGADVAAASIRSHGGNASAHCLDVTDEASWAHLNQSLTAQGQQLDIVINSAGISFSKRIEEMTLAEWQRVLDVNLVGVFLGTRFGIRALRGRTGGSIVNVASASGLKALPGASAYCVSKTGVCMLTRVAALECAQAGSIVRVNAVLPGGVKTPLWRQMDFFAETVRQAGSEEAAFEALGQAVPLKRCATPEEIAGAILYLASEESAYITGAELVIDGGWTA